jgi:ribose 5-phosphate isomerase A
MDDATTELKRKAGERAVDFIRSGMVVGLGHGTTAIFALRRIARMLKDGQLEDIQGIPCSQQVEHDARELGIPLTTLDAHPAIDVTIDGADEITMQLNLIKGGGGALLREKIVAQASHREIIVIDASKLSPHLGTHWAVPVEVVPFGWRTQLDYLTTLGAKISLRREEKSGTPFRTDQGNLILDCDFGPLDDPAELAAKLTQRAGIIEHGLFLDLVTDLIIGDETGTRHIKIEN